MKKLPQTASEVFVLLGGPPFEPEANQTSLQMFHALGKNGRSLYVCRRFQGSIARRLLRGSLGKSTTALTPGLRKLRDQSYILVLPTIVDILPLINPEWCRKLALLVTQRSIAAALRTLGWQNPTLISYWWMFPEIAQMSCWRARVFDVIDRHWGYAHVLSDRARRTNLELTLKTAHSSDRVCVVSDALAEELRLSGVSSTVLPNAIDLHRVINAIAPSSGRENLAVYAGGWNERLDLDLLENLVRKNKDWRFAFLGSTPSARFSSYPNVTFCGDVPYEEVLVTLKRARIGLVPFLVNDFTEASNFLKVLDYMACGVRVGATPIKNLERWAEDFPSQFRICESATQWAQLFSDAEPGGRDDAGVKDRIDLKEFSTDARAAALSQYALTASSR